METLTLKQGLTKFFANGQKELIFYFNNKDTKCLGDLRKVTGLSPLDPSHSTPIKQHPSIKKGIFITPQFKLNNTYIIFFTNSNHPDIDIQIIISPHRLT